MVMRPYLLVAVVVLGLFAGCSAEPDTTGKDLLSFGYTDIAEQARGTVVRFYINEDNPQANHWIDEVLCPFMKKRHDISVVRVPMPDSVFSQEIIHRKSDEQLHGTADLVAVNGRSFRALKMAGALFGPYAEKLPNYLYFVNKALAAVDFGLASEGYQTPFGKSQFVFEYDTERISNPPRNFIQLQDWIKLHPGKFTYCKPTVAVGRAFVRHVLFSVSGGADQYFHAFDRSLMDKNAPQVWRYLNDIKPFQWENGKAFPDSTMQMDDLFASGEIFLNMSYQPLHATNKMLDGKYPLSVRSYVMEDGSLFHLHGVAIPFNAPNKAGAMVLANVLMAPEIQLSKFSPVQWGDYPGIDVSKLSGSVRDRFAKVYLGRAAASPHDMARFAVPEISTEYDEYLERGWKVHIVP